ncbi:MAG: hypothetical protein J6Y99_01655 [Bacteroidales bacterium]|nr:hypothetical protein [Bacteroidales bacterium]
MATMTNEQIEQKKQQLNQLVEEVKQLKDQLVEAGAWPMDEDELDQAAGGGLPIHPPIKCGGGEIPTPRSRPTQPTTHHPTFRMK